MSGPAGRFLHHVHQQGATVVIVALALAGSQARDHLSRPWSKAINVLESFCASIVT